MASPMKRSSSTTVFLLRRIVIAFDAIKSRNMQNLKDIITNIQRQDNIIQEVDSIMLLGVLDKVLHPLGFKFQIGSESFIGAHARAIEEEISRKVDEYVDMLQQSIQGQGVDIEVKIAVGAPVKKIIVQEVVALDATWAILDRQLRKDLKFYIQHIPCKVAHVVDNLSLQVLRPYYLEKWTQISGHKLIYSLSKPVPLPPSPDKEIGEPSDISMIVISKQESTPSSGLIPVSASSENEERVILQDESNAMDYQELQDCSDKLDDVCEDSCLTIQVANEQIHSKGYTAGEAVSEGCSNSAQTTPDEHPSIHAEKENKYDDSSPVIETNKSQQTLDAPDDDVKIKNLNSMGFTYSMIRTATDYFSSGNMLGESIHGVVYKGQLKDGYLIAVKVQKSSNAQDFDEFKSRAFILNNVCHSNIEKLLGYFCEEDLNILVYEYICNKSLEWHLFDNTKHVLEWHHRQAIALGTAKGLHFLHKEWQGSPLIHRDIRPSNILLTNDFVPLLGNCSLSKWKTDTCGLQTRSPYSLVYLAPEYAESGIFSMETDLYALGIVLIQLISGQKAVDSTRDNSQQSLRQWALPLIQTLALDDLVDPRLENSYYTYELYNMVKAAYMCIQTDPEIRPTAEEVLHLLEGTNDHLRHLKTNLYPIILSTDASLS